MKTALFALVAFFALSANAGGTHTFENVPANPNPPAPGGNAPRAAAPAEENPLKDDAKVKAGAPKMQLRFVVVNLGKAEIVSAVGENQQRWGFFEQLEAGDRNELRGKNECALKLDSPCCSISIFYPKETDAQLPLTPVAITRATHASHVRKNDDAGDPGAALGKYSIEGQLKFKLSATVSGFIRCNMWSNTEREMTIGDFRKALGGDDGRAPKVKIEPLGYQPAK